VKIPGTIPGLPPSKEYSPSFRAVPPRSEVIPLVDPPDIVRDHDCIAAFILVFLAIQLTGPKTISFAYVFFFCNDLQIGFDMQTTQIF